jgi:nucleotide-binding universal stress UspA family protein
MMDGKHSTEIVADVNAGDYDLVVLGVLGLGRVRDSSVGSVCERGGAPFEQGRAGGQEHSDGRRHVERDTILVGIDGSPQSFGALMTAHRPRQALRQEGRGDRRVRSLSPLHGLQRHRERADREGRRRSSASRSRTSSTRRSSTPGLAQIYQSHLEVAEKMAAEAGVEITKTLLDGKAFQKVLNHARKTNPWLLIVGRIGIHSAKEETDLGSNTGQPVPERALRHPLTTRLEYPELDVKAEESIRWTPEAEQRMTRSRRSCRASPAPAIFRLAGREGHSVITSDLLDEAMDRYMPKGRKAATKLAEAVILEHAAERSISICRKCGVSASEAAPVVCAVCGGTLVRSRDARDGRADHRERGRSRGRIDLRWPEALLDARFEARAVDHPGRLQAPARQGPRREVGASCVA